MTDQTVQPESTSEQPPTSQEPPPAKKAPAKKAAKRAAAKKSPTKKSPAKDAAGLSVPATKAPVERADTEVAPADVEASAESSAPRPDLEDAAPPAKKTPRKRTAKPKSTAPAARVSAEGAPPDSEESEAGEAAPPAMVFQAPEQTPHKQTPRKQTPRKAAPASAGTPAPVEETGPEPEPADSPEEAPAASETAASETAAEANISVAGEIEDQTPEAPEATDAATTDAATTDAATSEAEVDDDDSDEDSAPRRRRRRGGRRRRKPSAAADGEDSDAFEDADQAESPLDAAATVDGGDSTQSDQADLDGVESDSPNSRRRRRRRRAGEPGPNGADEPENTVVKVRDARPLDQQITAVSGSTRLEAKKQRRREGREAGRRRAPIVSEAEFLARREAVDRVMVIRERDDLTQIAVLEDKVLVEHYVARESQTSLIGNVYLGRVQNVLPSMEAAFVDIGKGRNAVLYAGEVNWAALGHQEGQPRKIESVLSSGQRVLVQVTKDPVGHKGARLTSQISLAGRFMVYVPDGTTSGISRKLPDTERARLKALLKDIVPDTAGVIVRTAAEGASEEELTRDVERLKARWSEIEKKAGGNAPQLLYGEPDLTLKVVRDLFTEDFSKLVVQGDGAWEIVQNYVDQVAPDLAERLERFDADGATNTDIFATYRIDEQIAKGLDRKVWLPSGGSLIIDRTEAMTVVDVNTGKFTGSGGNLEETVTKNNLEAAEEIVRQLRLRDIGGIIVIDFIDMVLESNRDLVLRRMVECLGRDRTRHQVAEVTSLGLVQMTRKRIGTGLLEAFSETCSHCGGRGLIVHDHPIEGGSATAPIQDEPRRNRRSRSKPAGSQPEYAKLPSPKDVAAMIQHHDDVDGEDPAEFDAAEIDAAEIGEGFEESDESGEDTVDLGEDPVDPGEDTVDPGEDTVDPGEDTIDAAEVSSAAIEHGPVVSESEVDVVEPVPVLTRARRGASRAVVSTGEGTVMAAPSGASAVPIVTPDPPKVITRTRGGSRRSAQSHGSVED